MKRYRFLIGLIFAFELVGCNNTQTSQVKMDIIVGCVGTTATWIKYVYYKGNKYSLTNSPQEYERYVDDSVRQAIYTSIGHSIDFNAIDSLYPTAFFEESWKPTLPDNITEEEYTLTLTVK